MANGEPVALVDALEANHERLEDVRLHQMHALHERPYIHGEYAPRLRHVSYFLAPATREAYWNGGCDLVPNHFSEIPMLLRSSTRCTLVLRSVTSNGRSRIRVRLTEGSVVTTLKNTVDHVVTEWGIAELRGRPLAERARALIAIAHPDHRDALEAEAREAGVLPDPGGTGAGGAAPPGRRARPAAPAG
jgi:acyl-CoA hydrolase